MSSTYPLWFIGFCILLTGIISVGNIMYVNINERTREIGIRKAIGATPRNILDMILIESVVLTSIAGLVGMFFGYLVIQLIKLAIKSMAGDNMFLANVGVNIPIIIGSFVLLILAGVIAGILPAIGDRAFPLVWPCSRFPDGQIPHPGRSRTAEGCPRRCRAEIAASGPDPISPCRTR